jgi:hypothetical protein
MSRSALQQKRAILRRLAELRVKMKAQERGAEAFAVLSKTDPLPGGKIASGVILGMCFAALAPSNPGSQGFIVALVHSETKRRKL